MFLLAAVCSQYIPAQTDDVPSILEAPNIPQWVKDLRRWEIVAFGSIPFTMFTATFAMDMNRWSKANGMSFSDEGRRYAPWPLKSAGAISMERKEQETVFIIAAGLSVAIAMADLAIVQIRRQIARKKAEALPVGTTIIIQKPWSEETSEAQDSIDIKETVPAVPDSVSPEQP